MTSRNSEVLWKNSRKIVDDGKSARKEQSAVQPSDIVEWVQKYRKINGKKFSFENREYLLPIYRDVAKEIYVVKARQMEVTELAANWMLYNLLKHPNTTGIYTTDRADHITVFSKERLRKKIIRNSAFIKSQVAEAGSESYLPFVNGSVLWMFSGWDDFETARSVSADFLVLDEMQSLNVGSLATIKESVSRSIHGKILGIGTGSVYGDDWYKTWHAGNQNHWNVQKKIWIPRRPEITNVSSYHLSQQMAPWILPEHIEQKRRRYTPRSFQNEVDGWWYRGGSRPLVEDNIRALMDSTLDFTSAPDVDHTLGPVYAGFDWGGGVQAHTVAWIMQLINKDLPRFKLLYTTKLDDPSTEAQADKAIRLIDAYECDRVVMDAGGGPRQVEKLSNRYAERVYKCHYISRPEKPFEPIDDENRLNVDRTWIIETIIDLIKRPETRQDFPQPIPRLLIPGISHRLELIEWIIDHFTCIEAETANAAGRSRTIYMHSQEANDDALHACCYAYLAKLIDDQSDWFWVRL